MDTQKIVIVVLIVIIVVFVIFEVRGSLSADQPKRGNQSDAVEFIKQNKTPGWSKTINRLFGGLQESVVLKCVEISPPNAERQCEKLPLGTIDVPPAKDPWLPFLKKTSMRTVKLVLINGIASVNYHNRKGGNNIEDPQHFELPNFEKNESLVITESGGTLTISCKENAVCQVGQK